MNSTHFDFYSPLVGNARFKRKSGILAALQKCFAQVFAGRIET
jgi:hypothetical protein